MSAWERPSPEKVALEEDLDRRREVARRRIREVVVAGVGGADFGIPAGVAGDRPEVAADDAEGDGIGHPVAHPQPGYLLARQPVRDGELAELEVAAVLDEVIG